VPQALGSGAERDCRMSRDDIRFDQIQQRLGSFGRQPPAYDDIDSVSASSRHGADGASAGGGFVALVAVIFMAVGSGTFFIMSGGDISDVLGWL
jgi:hypothetical protein